MYFVHMYNSAFERSFFMLCLFSVNVTLSWQRLSIFTFGTQSREKESYRLS